MEGSLGQLVVRHDSKIIDIVAETSAHHAIRLERLHKVIQLLTLPRLKRTHIEPQFGNRAITGQQFLHLGLTELMMLRGHEIGIVAGNRIGMWKIPVNQREVETEIQPVSATCLGEFPHEVAPLAEHIHAVV